MAFLNFRYLLFILVRKKINLLTASSVVIANMIGTGVFISLDFQLSTSKNSFTILNYGLLPVWWLLLLLINRWKVV